MKNELPSWKRVLNGSVLCYTIAISTTIVSGCGLSQWTEPKFVDERPISNVTLDEVRLEIDAALAKGQSEESAKDQVVKPSEAENTVENVKMVVDSVAPVASSFNPAIGAALGGVSTVLLGILAELQRRRAKIYKSTLRRIDYNYQGDTTNLVNSDRDKEVIREAIK